MDAGRPCGADGDCRGPPQGASFGVPSPLGMPEPPPSDAALMAAVQAGDLDAFQALYERHHRAVFGFLLRSVHDRRAAEDLLQETFLRVFAARQTYRPLAAFRTWLFTVARHLVIDRARRSGSEAEGNAKDTLDALVDPDASPLQHIEAQELAERLERGVRQLPPAQREILLLSRVVGLSHDEVARVTGTSAAAVRVALHRALRGLRAWLGSP